MPDFKHALSEEIRRIARKEIKQMLTPVLAKMSEMRKTISAQEKTIREMQKRDFASTAPAETPAVEKTAVAKIPRITQARIVKLREKLGLSQAEFSKLLGISLSTISHWETGKTAPRLEQKIRLAEIRDMGKHELEEMFKGKGITVQVEKTVTESSVSFDKECLTAFRKAHGLSKASLALLLGVSQFSIGRWESGKGLPREAQKTKIMELLALPDEQLRQKLAEFPEKKRGTGKRVAALQETPAEDGNNE